MEKSISDKEKSRMNVDAKNRIRVFDGKKTAKLGTEKNPAVVHVQTKERFKEVLSLLEEHDWKYTIGL